MPPEESRFQMPEIDPQHLMTIITHTVERYGCRIVEVDLENRVVNIEGPEDAQVHCAIALQDILG